MTEPRLTYTLESCTHCLHCMKICPVEAIHLEDGIVKIDPVQCIDCGICVAGCPKGGLTVEKIPLEKTLSSYDYKVALVPGSFFAQFASLEEAGQMLKAIQSLGFDEVVDYSDIEGALYLEGICRMEVADQLCITSFCPSINALIEKNYPMLFEHLLDLEYPCEVAARQVRARLEGKYSRIGIYSLCDCLAKMALAKAPFGNQASAIDHAVAISQIFPAANRQKGKACFPVTLNREGLMSNVSDFYHYAKKKKPIIAVDGVNHCIQALETAEFGALDKIGLLALFACQGGCIGGSYLWSNPFIGEVHMEKLSYLAGKHVAALSQTEMSGHRELAMDKTSMPLKMQRYRSVNEVLEKLPRFDCGACGYPNCRALAGAIVDGKAGLHLCRVRKEE